MNAGKSTLLLQASHNYQERGMKTYLITAQLDNRAGEGQIGSRIGIDASADTFTVDDDLFYKIKLIKKTSFVRKKSSCQHRQAHSFKMIFP